MAIRCQQQDDMKVSRGIVVTLENRGPLKAASKGMGMGNNITSCHPWLLSVGQAVDGGFRSGVTKQTEAL
jgi:hypothetical protein